MTVVVQPATLEFDLPNLKLFLVQKNEEKIYFVAWPEV